MTLQVSVAEYITRRRAGGSPFVSSEVILRAFCRFCGDIELQRVRSKDVSSFVNRPGLAAVTRLSNFSVVSCFIRDCVNRELLHPPKLIPPAQPQRRREPFIYTHAQVRSMLANTSIRQASSTEISPLTLKLCVLLLYATGASVAEVLTVRSSDCNLETGRITFRAGVARPRRSIPLSPTLTAILSAHPVHTQSDAYLLRTVSGKALSRSNLYSCIKRLLRISGIQADANEKHPRLQDMRYTFAVHRIRAWIEAGQNLSELLPALSTYMGYASLLKSEEFLAYAPERFHNDLLKLSPTRSSLRWRDDASLIRYLEEI